VVHCHGALLGSICAAKRGAGGIRTNAQARIDGAHAIGWPLGGLARPCAWRGAFHPAPMTAREQPKLAPAAPPTH